MTRNFNNFNFDEDKSIRNKYAKIEHVLRTCWTDFLNLILY